MLYRVINCDAHSDRLESFLRASGRQITSRITRQPCVNGRKFTESKMCSMVRDGIVHPNADLTPIEIAIALSHRKCWEALVRSDHQHMLIFEDDAHVKVGFKAVFDAAMESVEFDILYMVNGNWGRTKTASHEYATVKNVKLYREMKDYNAGLACYCIHRDFADQLLERQFPMRDPVDNFIGSTLVRSKVHLCMETRKDRNDCYTISPIASMNCPIIGSNKSTQDHAAATMKQRICKKNRA